MYDNTSRKELKQLKKIEKLQRQNLEQKKGMMKWIVISISGFVFLALFVFLIVSIKGGNSSNGSNNGEASQEAAVSFSTARHVRGNLEAPIVLTEFADIQCPACRSYHPIVKSLLDIYGENLKLEFRHLPLTSIHPNSQRAAIAAEAAGKQDKFFEMVDFMYENQDDWASLASPKEKFEEYAENIGLDVEQYLIDVEDKELNDLIGSERDEAISNGVNSTPSFFLNGRRIANPDNLDEFQQLIDAEIAFFESVQTSVVEIVNDEASELSSDNDVPVINLNE